MKRLVFYSLLLVVFKFQSLKADCDVASETTASGTFYKRREKLCSGDLIFEDQFETFDLARWQHEISLWGGGNGEFQFYNNNRTNSYVQEGSLHLKPSYLADHYGEDFLYSGTLDLSGACTNAAFSGCRRTGTKANILNPIKSAKLRTKESFSFRYGTVVVKAKLPAGDWLWPAIWLFPHNSSYGTWPSSGEIDLIESRGNKNFVSPSGVSVGVQQVSSTLHWGPSASSNQWSRTHFEKRNDVGYDTNFHVYKLVWSSNGFVFFIDDEKVGFVTPPDGGFWEMGEFASNGVPNPWEAGSKMAPFDQQFYLIINLAVGGTNFFSDDFTNSGGKPWKNWSPTAMTDFWTGKSQWEPTWNLGTDDSHLIVDYVQIYAI